MSTTLSIDVGVGVRMADGVPLVCDIFRPAGPGAWPAILLRTPYDRSTAASRSLQIDAVAFAESGYVVVVQDVRGRYGSEGEFRPFVDEQSDGVETIEWMAAQPWCNGRIAMAGISYLGYSQIAAAAALPESLVAIAPGLTAADVRDGWFTESGVFNAGFNLAWTLGALLPADSRTTDLDAVLAAYDNPLSTTASEALIASSAISDAWAEWQKKDPYPECESVPGIEQIDAITIPSLVTAGWFDIFQPGTFELLEALQSSSLIAGPWGHVALPLGRRLGQRDYGRAAQLDMHQAHSDFFDLHLRGGDAAVVPAAVFVTGADRWETMSVWPPPGRQISLFADRTERVVVQINPDDPTPSVGGRTFAWDPVVLPGCFDQTERERRADTASFTTDPLSESLFVAGPVEMDVDAGDHEGMIFVVVCDVDTAGRSWNVADGVAVGALGPVKIRLGHLAHVFEPGHKVRVSLSFGAYPRYRWDVSGGSLSVGVPRLHLNVVS